MLTPLCSWTVGSFLMFTTTVMKCGLKLDNAMFQKQDGATARIHHPTSAGRTLRKSPFILEWDGCAHDRHVIFSSVRQHTTLCPGLIPYYHPIVTQNSCLSYYFIYWNFPKYAGCSVSRCVACDYRCDIMQCGVWPELFFLPRSFQFHM
jgi:hypothetical protein